MSFLCNSYYINQSHSNNYFSPLNEFKADGIEGLIYVSKRCASISIISTIMFKNLDQETKNNLLNRYEFFSEMAFKASVAVNLRDNNDQSINFEQITNDIKEMSGIYKRNIDNSYIQSGQMISSLIKDDTEFCRDLFLLMANNVNDSGLNGEMQEQSEPPPAGATRPRPVETATPTPTPRPFQTESANITVLSGGWCVPGNDCIGPEPISHEGFSTCEDYCALSNPVTIQGFDAMLFDVSCNGDWGEGERDYRMLLAEYEDHDGTRGAAILTPNGVKNLVRCSDDPAPQTDQSAQQCDFNSRLYRAKPGNPDLTDQYHELQFVDGYTSGTATITEYREGKPIWRATGEHACSNGAVICSLLFPTMTGEVSDAPFEVLTDEQSDYKTIVVPAFSQNVYLSERYATLHHGKSYGGLVAEFLNGFAPTDNELLLPRNVYEFAGCGPSQAE